ncbi:MAG: hypothetical protein D6776_07160 [Planctomycetota bacterium]|nr:MAG: hypothetical protein D6776_07160 [Planctomycetota bacterium]
MRPSRAMPRLVALAAGLLAASALAGPRTARAQPTAAQRAVLEIVFGGGRGGRLGDVDARRGGSLARELTLRRRLMAAPLAPSGAAAVRIGLDLGDTLFPAPASRADRGRTILETLQRAGCDALVVGPRDLALGIEPLSAATRWPRAPQLLSASLRDAPSNTLLFPPYLITGAGGLRVAVIGLTRREVLAQAPARVGPRLRVLEEIEAARAALAELERVAAADVVVCAGNFPPERGRTLAHALPRLDAVLAAATGPLPSVRAASWLLPEGRDPNRPTALVLHPPGEALGLSVLRLELRRAAATRRWRIVAARLLTLPLDASVPEDRALARRIATLERRSRPRSEPVWIPRFADRFPGTLRPDDFARLVASILREKTGAELAVLHERLFDPAAFAELARERDLRLSLLERLLRYDDAVTLARLQGRDLLALLERARRGAPLVIVGASRGERGRHLVQGRPVEPGAWYDVVTSDFLASERSPVPELKRLRDARRRFAIGRHLRLRPASGPRAIRVPVRKLVEWVFDTELRGPPAAGREALERYRRLADKRRAAWELRFDNLRITFTGVGARHDPGFEAVRDKRANAQRQIAFSGAGRIQLTRYGGMTTTSWRVDMRYTRVKVSGEKSRASEDDLRFRGDLSPVLLSFRLPGLPVDLAPLGSAEFDTEFEKPETPDAHRQKEAFLTFGIQTPYPQHGLEQLRLGTFVSYQFTDPDNDRWKGGFEFEGRHRRRWARNLEVSLGVRARWFPFDQQPARGDLTWFVEPQVVTTLPLIEQLRFVFEVNGFLFKERHTARVGSQYAIAFGVSFSRLWRLGRDPLLPTLR